MKQQVIRLLFLTVYLFATIVTEAQKDTIISDNEIKKSIQTFIKLIGSDDAREYGLKNIAELNSLKAGKQFKKYMIGLTAIKNYQRGNEVGIMIKEYPAIEVSLVNSTGKIRTSIEFVKNQGKWEASRYGSTSELILLSRAQDMLADSVINKGNLIRIPALRISFIAVASGSGLNFISLEDRPDLDFHKGRRMAASEAILKLVPLANQHKNFPN
jgi:hypothetical protein